jgi:hypothetical protein
MRTDRGTPVVFYESGKSNGRSAAIVVARVISTVVVPKGQIAASLLERGVVDDEGLEDFNSGKVVAATTVDNVLKLRRPVSFKTTQGSWLHRRVKFSDLSDHHGGTTSGHHRERRRDL